MTSLIKYCVLTFIYLLFSSSIVQKKSNEEIKCIIKSPTITYVFSVTIYSDKTLRVIYGEPAVGSEYFHEVFEDKTTRLSKLDYKTFHELKMEILKMDEIVTTTIDEEQFEIDLYVNNKRFNFYFTDQEHNALGKIYSLIKQLSPIPIT